MARYGATILLGAFLLFQVQPQLARFVLPWFGGGTAVWSTCMLFFQAVLLAGYAYAHMLRTHLSARHQALVHGALLLLSLAFLPVVPAEHWKPDGAAAPAGRILLLLTATVGVPYLLLAATGPLLQSWFAREFAGRSPYRLYALSNVGSLAALLSFPFAFEPNLRIAVQADIWAAAYVAFGLLCGACAWRFGRSGGAALPPARARTDTAVPHDRLDPIESMPAGPTATFGAAGPDGGVAVLAPAATATAARRTATATAVPAAMPAAPRARQVAAWLALAALPSVVLLATTNMMCRDIAVVPFFWVMPLALYLLTFILTFDSDRWYRARPMAALLTGTAVLVLLAGDTEAFATSIAVLVPAYASWLLLCGMVCHGELVRRRPAVEHLTVFYLAIALGGAIGGVFVALLAPLLFDSYLEVEIGLVGSLLAAAWACGRGWLRNVLAFGGAAGAIAALVLHLAGGAGEHLERSRNFYGELTVDVAVDIVEDGGRLVPHQTLSLMHGRTLHGRQTFGPGAAPEHGMTYYWPGSGVGHALTNHPRAADGELHVGVVGLGAGTLAAYARRGDHYTFYEIDPAVARVADRHFTYLRDARGRGARIEIVLGDARVQLERELGRRARGFDALVVDAFSSDAIPIHLLTRECSRGAYWRHLAADGLLLMHISNRHVDLVPVVRGLARDAGKELRVVYAETDTPLGRVFAHWAIVTDNRAFLSSERMGGPRRDVDRAAAARKPSVLWTDDFSSLWHVLR